MNSISIKRSELFDVVKNYKLHDPNESKKAVLDVIVSRHGLVNKKLIAIINKELGEKFFNNVHNWLKLINCKTKNKYDQFVIKHKKWLEGNFTVEFNYDAIIEDVMKKRQERGQVKEKLDFYEASSVTQRKRTISIANSYSVEELSDSLVKKIKLEGQISSARLIKMSLNNNEAEKILQNVKNEHVKKMSLEDTLDMVTDRNFSKRDYEAIRTRALKNNCQMYPSWNEVKIFRESLYPQNISVDDNRVEAPLQDIVNLTIERLFRFLGYWKETEKKRRYVFDLKLGFDTTTATGFRHKKVNEGNRSNNFINDNSEESTSEESDIEESDEDAETDHVDEKESSNENDNDPGEESIDDDSEDSSDQSDDEIIDNNGSEKDKINTKVRDYIIVTLLVLVRVRDKDTEEVLWQNPLPNSTRFCRPLRLNFTKDTNEITIQEKENIDREIKEFVPMTTPSGTVECNFQVTMLDGKVSYILGGGSSGKCYLCEATTSQFNDTESLLQRPIKTDFLKLGFPVLHAKIRLMESVLRVSKKLKVQQYMVRKTSKDSGRVKKRGLKIQRALKSKLNILVDQPKQNYGNTNDGNTARKFFEKIKFVNKILGFNWKLLKRLKNINSAISCGKEIHIENYKNYCHRTARLWANSYKWYPMPISLHIILIHSWQIIEALGTVKLLNEECLEATHKYVKHIRCFNARKDSTKHNNLDVFHALTVRSDPVIALNSMKIPQKHMNFNKVLKNLLILEEN